MTFVAGVAGPDAAGAAARLRTSLPNAELLAEPGLALAWSGIDVSVARAEGLLCVAAGAPAADVAAAWARGGENALANVRGGFAAVLWDAARERGLLAAGPLGIRAFVLRRHGRGVTFALEPRDLLPLLRSRPGPDGATVTAWLERGELPADATLFAGIERLPGGHLLELGAEPRRRRYWTPAFAEPEPIGRAEAEARVRDGLERAVAHVSAPEAGILLSGGLDSAAVAAAAVRAGRRPPGYSVVFPGEPEVDEAEAIAETAGALGLPSTVVPYDGAAGLLAATRAHVETWSLPPTSPTIAVHAPLLRQAAGDGVGLLLDGQGGDELFGSSLEVLADLLRAGRLGAARDLAHRLDGIPRRLRGRAARRALLRYGLAPLLPGSLRAAARALRGRERPAPWLRLDAAPRAEPAGTGPAWWRVLADALTSQRERAGAHDHLRRRNADAGVAGAHPLLQDRELIELVLGLPPALAFDAERDRPLLRGALRGLLPERVLERRGKAFFTPLLVHAAAVTDAAEIRRLLLAPGAEIGAYADLAVVRGRLLDAPAARRGGAWAWSLWRLAALELWLAAERGRA